MIKRIFSMRSALLGGVIYSAFQGLGWYEVNPNHFRVFYHALIFHVYMVGLFVCIHIDNKNKELK